MKVYIAGAYTASSARQRLQNTANAIDAGIAVWNKGHYPYIPHLTHFVDARAKRRGILMRWRDYMIWDKVWLQLCDAFLMLNNSRGVSVEAGAAKRLGLQIFRSLAEIPNAGPHPSR